MNLPPNEKPAFIQPSAKSSRVSLNSQEMSRLMRALLDMDLAQAIPPEETGERYRVMAELLSDIPAPVLAQAIDDWNSSYDELLSGADKRKFQVGKSAVVPAAIRKLAEARTTDVEIREAFDFTLHLIRTHGVDLKPQPGRVIWKHVRPDDTESVLVRGGQEPDTPVPAIPERLKHTLTYLGYGDMSAGLRMVSAHPVLDKDASPKDRLFATDQVEGQFRAAWNRAGQGVRATFGLRVVG